jgi:selenocysteine-specific elongation factor
VARLLLEAPLVVRGGDRFVLRSFSPVTTIGGGIVLDPFPRAGTGRRHPPRLAMDQTPTERLRLMAVDAGLHGLPVAGLAVRLGVPPARVTAVIAEGGAELLTCGETLVARTAITAEVTRLAEVLRRHHEEHPLDPGMSLQALRAAVVAPAPPPAVLDQILDLGIRKRVWELAGSVVRVPGWRPALDARTTDARALLARRLEKARWQVPTVAELVREFPDTPVRALLAHLAREGGVEQVDQDRYAWKPALEQFRVALDAALTEVGAATPAVLRDRLGLTRKYLIPLLEWADRRGITRRSGDARTLARLTAGSGGT